MTILFSIVHYNNKSEVYNFITNVLSLKPEQYDIYICICDNTGSLILENSTLSNKVSLFCPNKNLGYINGCAYAIDSWETIYKIKADWVIISNTDLILDKDFFHLFKIKDNSIGLVSPMVITNKGKIQNPHLYNRIPLMTLLFYVFIHKFFLLGLLYNYFSLKKSFKKTGTITEGTMIPIYASHGSCFALSKQFFNGGTLHRKSFLYGEEIFIAEQLRLLNLKAICNSNIKVIHFEHQITSSIKLKAKSIFMAESYIEVLKKFYLW